MSEIAKYCVTLGEKPFRLHTILEKMQLVSKRLFQINLERRRLNSQQLYQGSGGQHHGAALHGEDCSQPVGVPLR